MNKFEINQVFIDEYLTCGKTYDNFIFENCSQEFVERAQKFLSKENNNVKPCNIKITKEVEDKIKKVLDNCNTDIQKSILARDFIIVLVMKEVLKDIDEEHKSFYAMEEQLKAYYKNDFLKIKEYLTDSYLMSDIAEYSKKFKKIEINFFLYNTQNNVLQKAINNFISSRTPYSVKIFTTNKRLSSYYDQAGNLIQSPHDFMTRDVNKWFAFDGDDLLM